MNESLKVLYKSIQERYIKIVWTHKIQEIQGDIYFKKAKCIKRHICCFTVLTTGSALASILPFLSCISLDNGNEIDVISPITALFATALAYFTLRYGDGIVESKAQENKRCAAKLHNLRNKYESLMTDIYAGIISIEEASKRKENLEIEEDELYSQPLPFTSSEAVASANEALKINKDSTTEIEEIDLLVPSYLIVH